MDSWGNQSTLSGFITHLFRKEYGTFQLSPIETSYNQSLFDKIKLYYFNVWIEMGTFAIVYIFLGVCIIFGVAFMITFINTQKDKQMQTAKANVYFITTIILSHFLYVIVFYYLSNLDITIPLFQGIQVVNVSCVFFIFPFFYFLLVPLN